MNVWIVNPFDNLPLEGNRPQRYWLMARAFAQAGHCVTLWTSDFSHATKAKRKLTEMDHAKGRDTMSFFADDGFAVKMIPTCPYPTNVCLARISSHRRLARDFARTANQVSNASRQMPDLVIASAPPLGLCAAALRVAQRCRAKFVCDIQDAWPETFKRLLPCGFKWMGHVLFMPMRLTARRIYREADLVTGVCRRYAELSGRRDFHLAYHGIETEGNAAGNGKGAMTSLVYIGSLGAGYDLATVIDAVAGRQDLTFDIAGLGPSEARLRSRVKRLNLNGRVHFHGYLDSDNLRALLSRCAVGIIPMRDDSWVGLPYKLGDYLQAGLHVLSSLRGECGSLLERTGYGRTYDWGSADSLLAALGDLPRVSVSLPDELRAERIYPEYVRRVLADASCAT